MWVLCQNIEYKNLSFPVQESRDRILLDGNDLMGDEDEDEDEVFGLEVIESDSDSSSPIYTSKVEEDTTTTSKKRKQTLKKIRPVPSETPSEEESEEDTWGKNKSAYYSSNAAELNSDDDEANELELQEAMRLQQKGRDGMAEDDFGLGDRLDEDLQGWAPTISFSVR